MADQQHAKYPPSPIPLRRTQPRPSSPPYRPPSQQYAVLSRAPEYVPSQYSTDTPRANEGHRRSPLQSSHTTYNTTSIQAGSQEICVYRPSAISSVNNALQPLSHALARQPSPSPGPVSHSSQYLSQDTGLGNSSSRSPLPSTSAQRLPGVKDAPVIRKILSLDGGGVRGLSTIIILKHVMKILSKKRGFEVQPWEEFDMIGGTSTGGLLAIMLGRLRMSLNECEQKYLDMSAKIFTPARAKGNVIGRGYDFLQANGKFRSEPLEETIQEILVASNLPADALLMDDFSESCKVFVCATQAENSGTVVIRSYETNHHDSLSDSVKIWEAARATSAASTFFNPITIGPYGQTFVDGALKHNNPINLVDLESSEVWPQHDRIIISIGTGSAPGEDLLGNLKDLAKKLTKIVTDTEEENELFRRKHQSMIDNQRLYRFNVLQGLAEVGLEEHTAKARIASHTNTYLMRTDTQREVTACCDTLIEGAQRLDYVGGEDLTAHLARIALNDVMCTYCPHCLKGIPYNTYFYQCRECLIDVCVRCHGHHDRSHHQYFARCKAIQWEPHMQGLEPERVCDHCSQACKDRIECRNCPASLCSVCWEDRALQGPWQKKHYQEQITHKEFALVLPKHYFLLKEYEAICPCIDEPACINHCDRCLKPIRTGSSFYHCQSCEASFSSAQCLCETCLIDDLERHPPDHSFRSSFLQPDQSPRYDCAQSPGEIVRCEEYGCKAVLLPHDVRWHQHLRLRWTIGPLLKEIMHSDAVRKCPRLQLRRTFEQSANASKAVCYFCQKFVPFWNGKAVSLCIKSGCFQAFCDNCTEAKRQNHRHPLVECGFIKRNRGTGIGDLRKVNCDECRTEYWFSLFIGIRCAKCQNWDVCITCLKKGVMPKKHGSCDGKEWLFFRDQ